MKMPRVNYKDKQQVIAFAKSLGAGMTVFYNHMYRTYGITHTSRADLLPPIVPTKTIVYQT